MADLFDLRTFTCLVLEEKAPDVLKKAQLLIQKSNILLR